MIIICRCVPVRLHFPPSLFISPPFFLCLFPNVLLSGHVVSFCPLAPQPVLLRPCLKKKNTHDRTVRIIDDTSLQAVIIAVTMSVTAPPSNLSSTWDDNKGRLDSSACRNKRASLSKWVAVVVGGGVCELQRLAA